MRQVRMVACAAVAVAVGVSPLWAGAQPNKGGPSDKKASTAAESNICIPKAVESSVAECPANAPRIGKGTSLLGKAQAPKSNLAAAERRKEKPADRQMGPSVSIDAATLRNRENIQLRAAKLLDKEVTVLKRLIRNTPKDAPKRSEILLRLAETYFELQQQANVKVRSYDEPIFKARQQKNRGKVNQLLNEQKQAQKQLEVYRTESIRTYAQLVKDHPNFKRMDEVLFALAFTLDEMRQKDKSREVYFRLIKNYPESKFVPNAYLSFAEHYFAQGDMAAASKFYGKVTEFPPERNQVFGYALYKQAWCLYNLENFKGSLGKFVEVIEFGKSHPQARDVKNLVRQSRRELVMPYARAGTPGKALDFFRRFAENQAQAYEMLESLAELYYDTGDWPATIQVYHDLMASDPDSEKLCYWQSRVANAELARGDKKAGVTEVFRLVDIQETFANSGKSAEAVAECRQYGASTLIDLATAWHREAIGTDTQPGTNDRRTMELAAKLYRFLLDKFPDMEKMEFPTIDRRDWPTEYRVSYYHAELLWKMERWGECAPAFDKVVDLDPKGPYTADAALAAVLCYNNLYQQQFAATEKVVRKSGSKKKRGKGKRKAEPDEPDMSPREFTSLEEGMLKAFQRYVCFVPDSDDLPTMKYRRARIFYEANRYEEASVIFKDIAFNHRDSELSEYAANLYLDSLNVLASMRKNDLRPACYDTMAEAVPQLHGFYCATDDLRSDHEGLCGPLEQLRCDIQRKKAETHQARKEFREAAYAYVNIFRKYPECGKLDEVLYNSAINFEAAKLIGRAIKVRTVLIDKFPESELSKKAIYLTGANFQALALYSKAAEYYETFAQRFPQEQGKGCSKEDRETGLCPVASDALQDAVFFRLGLGDDETAVKDAELYERNYGRKNPRATSQVVYSLASIYERQNDWGKIAEHYQRYLKKYGRQALAHEEIRANVQIGVANWKLNRKPQAEKFFKTATKLWLKGAPQQINKAAGDEEKAKKWMAEGSQATAEALWYLAEYDFAQFAKIKFPELKGKADLKKVNAWAQGPFVKWIEAKGKALQKAEQAYGKVRELKAPMWDIAAAARVGVMYRTFVDEFRDAPVPGEIKKDPELMDIYLGSLDEKSQPWVLKATGAFEFCLNLATQVRWFNEFSQQCELELNRLDPRKYPMAAELRGTATYVQRIAADPTMTAIGRSEEEE